MSGGGADRSGEVLGNRYQLVRRIGTGGMGAVYEAIQSDLGRRVALKVLHSHLSLEPTLLERFRREALAAAALGHPNIVSVSDLQSVDDGPPFLVMELLTGVSLRQAIQAAGVMELPRVAFVGAQVLSALGAAHAERIIHRDVKPDNIILIDTTAMRDFVKVLDFGVAKLTRDNVEGLTMAGAILGTLSYMAPEQARGDKVDGRADVYSVGACMYHALTGRKPFDKKSRAELYGSVLLEAPVPLREIRPEIDAGLAGIVERALQKKAADRFDTAEDMVKELVSWQKVHGAQSSLPPPGAMRSPSLAPVTPVTPVSITSLTLVAPVSTRAGADGSPAEVLVPKPAAVAAAGAAVPAPRRLALHWVILISVLVGVVIERLYALLANR